MNNSVDSRPPDEPTMLDTSLWQETVDIPTVLATTLEANDAPARALAAALSSFRRVIVTGNGAAWYASATLAVTALGKHGRHGQQDLPHIVAVPAGLFSSGSIAIGPGDALLVVSSSGELRDVVDLLAIGVDAPVFAVTAHPESSIGRAAEAALHPAVLSQQAVTHTQTFVGNVACLQLLWALMAGDDGLLESIEGVGMVTADAVAAAAEFRAPDAALDASSAVVAGSGPASVAAQQAALIVSEVGGVVASGFETREAATTGMYALAKNDIFISLPTGRDRLLDEAELVCAGRGATVIGCTDGCRTDPRLATIATLPWIVSLGIQIGLARGLDVDQPAWVEDYYRTARA